jgi:hypothetical protein
VPRLGRNNRVLRRDGLGSITGCPYADGDPIGLADPLGLKAASPCGDYPKQTSNCAADCIARYEWGRCALHSVKSNVGRASKIFSIGGALVGFAFGPPQPAGKIVTTCIGLGMGFLVGMAVGSFQNAAAERGLRFTRDNCLRQCRVQACADRSLPPNLCQ